MSTANGAMAKSRADDVYLFPKGSLARQGIQPPFVLRNVRGENIRDWRIHTEEEALFPYTSTLTPVPYDESKRSHQLLWRAKEILWRRRELGGDHRELNRTWWEWNRLLKPRFLAKRRIAFAFVSTHNHFVLDRTRSMFSGSGPVILLKEQYDEADHLAPPGAPEQLHGRPLVSAGDVPERRRPSWRRGPSVACTMGPVPRIRWQTSSSVYPLQRWRSHGRHSSLSFAMLSRRCGPSKTPRPLRPCMPGSTTSPFPARTSRSSRAKL